jgi:diacylglycerol kinase family enzyme
VTQEFLVVANPAAGRQRVEKILRRLKAFFNHRGIPHRIMETQLGPQGKKSIRELAAEGVQQVVIIGGDGTIYETLNQIPVGSTIGIIPAGSGNDFVKNFSLGKNREEQFTTLVEGDARRIDLGRCNDQIFANGIWLSVS